MTSFFSTQITRNTSRFISGFSLGSYLLFYLFFALYDGVVIGVDSPTYIGMSFSREPFYPLLLAFFRLFNAGHYLQYVVIFQSILMAAAGWALADYLRKTLKLHYLYSSLLYLFPPVTSLLCRFAAGRKSMFTNSILSEGIATSLYLLFILFLFRYLLEKRTLYLMLSALLAFLMISTRKQMLMVIPLLILGIIFSGLLKRKEEAASTGSARKVLPTIGKGILQAALISLFILLAANLLDCSYNYLLRGQFTRHSSDNRFLTTMIFYNARETDADYIQDEEIRTLFLEIYSVCEEKGYLGSQAEEGWLNKVNHFGDHYDHIQIDTMWPMILKKAEENIGTRDVALKDLESDRINRVMIQSILPHQLPQLFYTLVNNFLSGLVITVAQLKPVFIVYSIFIYLAYIILFVRLWVIHQRKPSDSCLYTLLFSGLTLMGIVSNLTLVSAVIFCQTRYTIYNMPLFYMAGALLLYFNMAPVIAKLYPKKKDRGF